MKLSTMALAMLFSCSVFASEKNIEYANSGVDYESVVIKINSSQKELVFEEVESLIKSNFKQYTDDLQFFSFRNHSKINDSVLDRYLKIHLPKEKSEDEQYINELIKSIENVESIELVYPEPQAVRIDSLDLPLPLTVRGSINPVVSIADYQPMQYYLNAPDDKKYNYAVGGVAAYYAWDVAGGDGSGITVVQKEIGQWNENHLDLPASVVTFSGSKVDQHGTASMGIMGGQRNGYGVTGIAYNASFGRAGSTSDNFPDLIAYLKPGDVIQVGIHINPGPVAGCTYNCYQPMEASPLWFDFIKELTDKGVHVIQAAGNGGLNLDHSDFNGRYDRDIKDSGSNIVGAVCADTNATASFSNYGSRIDNSSWGCWDVVTTGYDSLSGAVNANYTDSYAGTSAANPIIAGATASLSGVAKAHGIDMSPKALRQLLVKTGTSVGDTRYIGTQPDLKRAIKELLGEGNGKPVFSGVSDVTVELGAVFDPMAGVTAVDEEGGDLTAAIEITGRVDTSKVGSYSLTYQVSDSAGEMATAKRIVTVFFDNICADAWNAGATYVAYDRVSHNGKLWQAGWWTKGNEPGTTGQDGVWREVTNSNCGETEGNGKPVFSGVSDVTVELGAVFDPMAGVTAVDEEGGDLTAAIEITGRVDTSKVGSYSLTYQVSDSAGEMATAKRIVTVFFDNICADTWNAGATYVAYDRVSHNGKLWQAGWWTKGDEPGTTGQYGVWREVTNSNC